LDFASLDCTVWIQPQLQAMAWWRFDMRMPQPFPACGPPTSRFRTARSTMCFPSYLDVHKVPALDVTKNT
jgi:hypothetical protein